MQMQSGCWWFGASGQCGTLMTLTVVLVVCAGCDFLMSIYLAMYGDKTSPDAKRWAACIPTLCAVACSCRNSNGTGIMPVAYACTLRSPRAQASCLRLCSTVSAVRIRALHSLKGGTGRNPASVNTLRNCSHWICTAAPLRTSLSALCVCVC